MPGMRQAKGANNVSVDFLRKHEPSLPNPLEPHRAESKWQFCNCGTCQRKRQTIDALPGQKLNYSTYRHKDEKY